MENPKGKCTFAELLNNFSWKKPIFFFYNFSSSEDDEELDDAESESSDGSRRGRRGGPVRRSTRARISRYDREFSKFFLPVI